MSILDGVEIFSDLTDEERDNLSMFCQEQFLKKGDVLFREEDQATAMYILKEGNIEISRYIDGVNTILGEINAEEILGEMALFGSINKRMATATLKEDSTLVVILSFSIKELTEKHPELLEKIKKIINDRMIFNKQFSK